MTDDDVNKLAELWQPVRDCWAECLSPGQLSNRDRLEVFLYTHLDDIVADLRAARETDSPPVTEAMLPQTLDGLTSDEDRALAVKFEVAVSTVDRWRRGVARPHWRVALSIILAAQKIRGAR